MKKFEEVNKYVKEECFKKGKSEIYNHLFLVSNYAGILGGSLIVGEIQMLKIAGLLHDIGYIYYGRKNHEITGAEKAEQLLRNFYKKKEKRNLIRDCILHHRSSCLRRTIEEKIIADSDNIAYIDNFCNFYDFLEGINQKERVSLSILEIIKKKHRHLELEESRNLIIGRYEKVMEVIQKC